MWRIFIESGDWVMVGLWIIVVAFFAYACRDKTDLAGKEIAQVLGFILSVVMTICMCFCVKQYIDDYGKEYTMVVDVYYPNNKVERKTFTTTNESISLSYPYRNRMSTEITTRTKSLFETTADVELISYTYKEKK